MAGQTTAIYAYCSICGSEYFDDDIKKVPFSATYANGPFGRCLDCGEEMPLEYETEQEQLTQEGFVNRQGVSTPVCPVPNGQWSAQTRR